MPMLYVRVHRSLAMLSLTCPWLGMGEGHRRHETGEVRDHAGGARILWTTRREFSLIDQNNHPHVYRQAIEGLTNALVSDSRVFHIADPQFFEMYNRQREFTSVFRQALFP